MTHLITPTLNIDYKGKTFDNIECDGDMKDDNGVKIPFCKETFKYRVQDGSSDLAEYVKFTINDRDTEVGQLRLKMQTLINGGNQQKLKGVRQKKKFVEELERSKVVWYPIFS